MWTPRRLLVLFVAAAGSAGLFFAYLQTTVGRVDGLPQLPADFLTPADDAGGPVEPLAVSPTLQRLIRAFGPAAPEVTDDIVYKLRFEERDKGLVFAMGQPEFGREASSLVRVSPCSVAFFADADKRTRRPAGQVEEISTFHADECVLRFDQPVRGPADIGKAKLLGMELVSKPERPSADPRRGRIWVTNNQKSADPNHRLVFRTPGPLFYQSAEVTPKPAADAPQVWTRAAVEVVDCRNLPRPLPAGTDSLPVMTGDALRRRGVVAAIVAGESLPPPTMTATGMKIYLKPKADTPDKRNSSGYGGVRSVELEEGVQINNWVEAGGGVPGGSAPAAPPDDPAGPVLGGLADGLAAVRRQAERSLLVIETSGPFRYDFEKSSARFDVAGGPDTGRANNVTVTRIGATGKLDDLVCTNLVVDFFGGPDKPGEGMAVKELTATGPQLYLSIEAEGFSANGQYLNYRNTPAQRTTVTTLRGSPVLAKKDKNKLEGGSSSAAADVVLTAIDPPPPTPGQRPGEKQSLIEVRGPGRMGLYDAASNDTTLSATWKTALIQQKDAVGARTMDLLKFEGGGGFADSKAGFTLTADKLWLWVAPAEGKKADGGTNALPQRLWAERNVVSRSADLEIGMAGQPPVDQLTVWFRDGPTPVGPAVAPLVPTPAPAAAPAASPPAAGPAQKPADPAPKPKEEKKSPPIQLSARQVETWVLRYPLPPDQGKKQPPAVKYEMERTRCDDRVVVHQDPSEPEKQPRGLDIAGQQLNLNQSRAGSLMTVVGSALVRAEVHFESTTILGPNVTIDQPNNLVKVKGAGLLRMPSRNDMGGGEKPADRPTELEVTWAKDMLFEGANARAEFVGAVRAVQTPDRGNFEPKAAVRPPPVALRPGNLPVGGPPNDDPTWSRTAVFCHGMDVEFDRPVYFSQMRRASNQKDDGGAKLRRVVCVPRPDDETAAPDGGLDRTVVYLEETLDRLSRKLTRAQRIECKLLDMRMDDARRQQDVVASGEGELRILQPGAKNGGPGVVRPASATGPADGEEMKLTLVRFPAQMLGVDQAKLFQSATFRDGARVWQTPTDDLNLTFDPAVLPPGTVHITCETELVVTSQKLKPTDTADQRLTATGSAEAYSDEYRGAAPTIRFLKDTTIFTGDAQRLAAFEKRQVGVGGKGVDYQRAREFVYNTKTGQLEIKGGATGAFTPGGR